MLNSLHQGRKATPWTNTATLLITVAEQSGGKENSALIKIPGEKPVELKIKLTGEAPVLRLATSKTEPHGQLILHALQQEIELLYTAKNQNKLAPVETLSFQQAATQLEARRLPAILSDLENLLAQQDGIDSLKTFVRTFRAELNSSSTAKPTAGKHTLPELNAQIEQSQQTVLEARAAIAQKDPNTLQIAEHLVLQRQVHQAYLDQTDKAPGIWISGNEIQTNRLWILQGLCTLDANPLETAKQSKSVSQAFENAQNPFDVITLPKASPADKNNGENNHYRMQFSPIPRLPQFEITPDPFEQPYRYGQRKPHLLPADTQARGANRNPGTPPRFFQP